MSNTSGAQPEYVKLPKKLARRMGEIQIIQELRNLLPPPTKEEVQRLEASLCQEGLRDPIVVGILNGGRDQMLLDGHTRLSICARLGLDLEQEELVVHTVMVEDIHDAKRWILRNQLGRRNLSESQRGMIAARLADLERGDNQHVAQATTSQGEAAAIVGVSRETVNRAAQVLDEGAPELIAAVDQGEIDVKNAAAVATLPKDEQSRLIEEGPAALTAAAKEVRKRKTRISSKKTRGTPVRIEGIVEVTIDIEIDVNAPPEKAIRTTVERLSDLGKACRLLRGHINPTILVDAISRAVQAGTVTISRSLNDAEERS